MQDTNDDTIGVQNEWSRFFENGVEGYSNRVSRRTVLRSSAIASGVVLGGSALAGNAAANRGNNYGNGNGIGAFLNEEAMWKESPVWDTGVADRTGQDEVDVLFGGLTDIDIPEEMIPPDEEVPDEGPWNLEPRVVKISPGTAVTWTWWEHGIPHGLVSFFDPPEHGREFHEHRGEGDTFTYTFEDEGTYLYFCHPHGTPYEVDFSGPEQEEFLVENLFGQRGAVIVSED